MDCLDEPLARIHPKTTQNMLLFIKNADAVDEKLKKKSKKNENIINKAKAISAKLYKLNLKVQLYKGHRRRRSSGSAYLTAF